MFRNFIDRIANSSIVQEYVCILSHEAADASNFFYNLANPNDDPAASPLREEPPEDPNKIVKELSELSERKEVDTYPVFQRCDSLILHGIMSEEFSPVKFNLILHVPGTDRLFSLGRTDDEEDAQADFILFRECLVPLVKIDNRFCNKLKLQEMSTVLRKNPGWTAAHLIAAMELTGYLKDPRIQDLINTKEGVEQKTPLHVAIEYGRISAVNELLNMKAQIDLTDINGNNIIHAAVAKPDSRPSILKALLTEADKRSPLLKVLLNCEGYTPLHIATHHNSVQLVKLLIQFGANFNIVYNILESPNKIVTELIGLTAQNEVSKYPVSQRCDSLILHGPLDRGSSSVKFNLVLHVPGSDKLFSLCRTDSEEEALNDYILFKECLVPIVKIDSHICNKYQLDEISAIVRSNPGWSVTHVIAAMDLYSYFKHLANQRLINYQDGVQLKTPLHIAVEYGKTNAVITLLDLNAQMELTDIGGNNVIHTAVAYYKPDVSASILKILLKEAEKRSPQLKDSLNEQGLTPLQIANEKNSTELAMILIQSGVIAA